MSDIMTLVQQRTEIEKRISNLLLEIEAIKSRGDDASAKEAELRSQRASKGALTRKINADPTSQVEAELTNTTDAEDLNDPALVGAGVVTAPQIDDSRADNKSAEDTKQAEEEAYQALTKNTVLSLRARWDDVYVDDPMMLKVKQYFCSIVLRKKAGSITMSPQDWEQKYGALTRQISGGKWIDNSGRPAQPSDTRPLYGGLVDASGIVIEIRGNKAHISTRMECKLEGGTRIHTPIGWTGTKTKTIIPAEWISPECIFGIMYGLKWHRTALNTWATAFTEEHKITKTTGADILHEGAYLYKLLVVARNRALFKGFMDNRAHGGQLCFDVAYQYGKSGDGKRSSVRIMPKDLTPTTAMKPAKREKFVPWHKYPNREELTNAGGYVDGGENNVYLLNHEGRMYTNQQKKSVPNVKKANARVTKLVIGGRPVAPIGRKVIFVAEDVPQSHHNLFVLGNCLVKASEFERLGPARVLSRDSHIKGVMMPWKLKSTGADMVMAKSTWKSAGNGILMCNNISPAAQIKAQHEGIKVGKKTLKGQDALEHLMKSVKKSTVTLKGNSGAGMKPIILKGWFVTDDIYATNLYATYGMRTNQEMLDENASTLNPDAPVTVVPDGQEFDDQEMNGFFGIVQAGLIHDPDGFDVMQARYEALKSGAYKYKSPKTQIKSTDFMSVLFSYGQDVAYKLIDAAIEQHMELKDNSRKACQKVFLLGTGKDIPTVDISVLAKLAAKVWVGEGGVKVHPEPGNFNSDTRLDYNNTRWGWLVDGDKSIGWPGLKTHKGINIIKKDGDDTFTFYLPPWSLFEKHLVEEEDVDLRGKKIMTRCLGEAWTHFIVLIRAIYTPDGKRPFATDWTFSQANHMANINRIVLSDVMNKVNVTGRYYVILPRWWDDANDTVTCIDNLWAGVSEILYLKNPTLFFNAVANMKINRDLPRGWVDFTPNMLAALSLCVFVPVQFMLRKQDDCDGDTACVMKLGGVVPTYIGEHSAHTKWNQSYEDGERDLKMTISEYVVVTPNEMHDGVLGAAKGKSDTGIMTANLFNVMFYIEVFMRENPASVKMETLRLIKEAYATAVQDEAVRQIKQESGGGEFFESAALYKHMDTSANEAAVAITAALVHRIKNVFGVPTKDYDASLIHQVVFFMVQCQRQDGIMKSATVDQAKIEAYRNGGNPTSRAALLFTRSYWDNVCKFAPQFAAYNDNTALEAYDLLQEMDVNKIPEWIEKHPVLHKRALAAGWADEFKHSSPIAENFYGYNRWIYTDGHNIDAFTCTCTGNMLEKLKVAYGNDKSPEPTLRVEQVVQRDDAVSRTIARLEARKAARDAANKPAEPTMSNKEVLFKLEEFFDCDVWEEEFDSINHYVVDSDEGSIEVVVADYESLSYADARKYVSNIVTTLKLPRKAAKA